MSARYLLIADVDDTILGDDNALREFASWASNHTHLLMIAYNSGRFIDSIMRSVHTTDMPTPRAVVGGIGTEIQLWPEGRGFEAWMTSRARGWNRERIRTALSKVPRLREQPQETQSPFKVSYFLPEASPDELEDLRVELASRDIEADYVYSMDLDLDWLPKGINKGSAARHLAEHLGFDEDHVIVAGNSGNDVHLFQEGYRGVVVGNAEPELRTVSRSRNYFAQSGYAAGVLEGLQHWLKQDGHLY